MGLRSIWVSVAFLWCVWASALPCFRLLQNASEFNPAALVSIYLDPALSARQRSATLNQLAKHDLILLNQPEHSPLIAQLTLSGPRQISAIPGVAEVTQAQPETLQVWKEGRSWHRVRESLMDNDLSGNWLERATPLRGMGRVTLKQIRQTARDYGVLIVLNRSRPASEAELSKEAFLFGGTVFYADDLPADPGTLEMPGLALHFLPNARSLAVRGTLNPLQSRGKALAEMNKREEMRVFERYAPEAIAPWIPADKLFTTWPGLEQQRVEALNEVNAFLSIRSASLSQVRILNKKLRSFFEMAVATLPDEMRKFFIKHRYDSASMESGQLWNYRNFQAVKNARAFYKALKSAKNETGLRGNLLDNVGFETHWEDDYRLLILRNLLLGGDEVFFQQFLPVRRSHYGNNIEFRVDVFQGRVVGTNFRYNLEYFPEEGEQAARFVAGVFARLPSRYRTLSAGLDVVQLVDGTFRIIEGNFGTASSFCLPDTMPIYANTALSNFLGKPTPLIRYLDSAFAKGLSAQAKVLVDAYADEPDADDDEAVGLTREDIFTYFRDRYVDNWRATPQLSRTMATPYQSLRALLFLAGGQNDPGLAYLAQTAADYVARN